MSPSLTRRDFLKQSSVIVVAGAATSSAAPFLQSSMTQSTPRDGRRLRVLLFHDATFPVIDCEATPAETLRRALTGCDLRIVNAAEFPAALEQVDIDLVITAHGSAFPEDAGMPLLGSLARGVSWLQLGGVPLAVPVRRTAASWVAAPRRTRWHRKLGITQAFPIDCENVDTWSTMGVADDLSDVAAAMSCDSAFALYWRLSSTKYFPDEDGSAGTRDGLLRALVSGMLPDGTAAVASVQMVDWLHGDYAGGRWVLYTGNDALSEEAIARLAAFSGCGAVSLTASPGFARYRPAEVPTIRVQLQRPRRAGEASCTVEIVEGDAVLHSTALPLRWGASLTMAEAEVQIDSIPPAKGRQPRFIEIRVHCPLPCAAGVSVLEAMSGFWIADDAALAQGSSIGRSAGMLTRAGAPFAVAGTTYMAGDVQRNFLLEPNPWVWRGDFHAMREAGINMIRTGIWYGWKRIMLEPGHCDEAVLRSMDAFLLVAGEADIPIIFTFFAFLPEAWGGENPYLDPRAVAAQQAFVGAFARRYASVPGLLWDLINEPSFSSPSQLWRCRPNYDRFELAAWHDWLRSRYPGMDDAARLRLLSDRWRSDTAENAALPALVDFDDSNLFSDRQPMKVLDYRLFAQEAFASWVRAISASIRSVDRKDRLIMVGQDEGGTMDRPHPQFFAGAVDITSVHSWWFNDDLLWDSVVTRAPGIPHLVQETGAMFYEQADGTPWRSEDEAARLIERKLAIAAGAGSAGFVQWLWNSNPYMPSDNEAAIGALRADGSAKPEFMVLRRMAHFLAKASQVLTKRLEERVVLVLPFADQFSVRGNGPRATRRAVRTLAYHCRLPLRAVSEYGLAHEGDDVRLYILPSPAVLTDAAWELLLSKAHAGATVLITGVLDRAEDWRIVPRSAVFGLQSEARPVSQTELLHHDGKRLVCGYRGDDLQRVEKAVVIDESRARVHRKRYGNGLLLWCPLPVEMCENADASAAVYRTAMQETGIGPACSVLPDLPGILTYVSRYRDATLLSVVSEMAEDVDVRVSVEHPDVEVEIALGAGRAVLVLLDQRGRVIMRSDE
ncbi:MAG: twin-arginine translocation signal domain-containing protein [Bacteroidetes bacterium]|nr:twin-arginine translocation signal domain-containing protein [Bacteroidota bacterium]